VDNQESIPPAPQSRHQRWPEPSGASTKRVYAMRIRRGIYQPDRQPGYQPGSRYIANPKPETLRIRKWRERKRADRKAAQEEAQEAARIAHKAALAAARAAKGLPPRKTQSEVQAAYRQRRKAKGLDLYSTRELAEQVTQKALEEANYENQVSGAVIDTWFAPAMDKDTALSYIREHIVPAQPQVAETYLERIQKQCRDHGLSVNRYTLKSDGVENAQMFRALTWLQNNGKFLSMSWDFAQFKGVNDLPKDSAARKLVFDASQVTIGSGSAIVTEMQRNAEIKERI
jgi:hypothetical protein